MDEIEELAAQIAAASAAIAAASAGIERLRADSARPASAGSAVDEMIAPGAAVKLSGLSRAQVHRRCKKYPMDAPDGFSLLPPGERTHRISKSRFEANLRAFPPRRYKMRRKR